MMSLSHKSFLLLWMIAGTQPAAVMAYDYRNQMISYAEMKTPIFAFDAIVEYPVNAGQSVGVFGNRPAAVADSDMIRNPCRQPIELFFCAFGREQAQKSRNSEVLTANSTRLLASAIRAPRHG